MILVADPQKKSLLDQTYQPHFYAKEGNSGMGSKKSGHSGEDFLVYVPVGTLVYHAEDRTASRQCLLADLCMPGQTFLAAKV